MNDGIQFELRKRGKKAQNFWTIYYDTLTGKILEIEPGNKPKSNTLVVSFDKIKNILSGVTNQNNFKIDFNETVGVLDLVNIRRPQDYKNTKKKQNWFNWQTVAEASGNKTSEIKVSLFVEQGFLRVESSREWSQQHREFNQFDSFDLYLTDADDPHIFFGSTKVPMHDLKERGYWEKRLWSFMQHDLVTKILYHEQKVRINIPPITQSLSFFRFKDYFPFNGITDDQTLLSHPGPGKHISVYVDNKTVWAKSNYEPGCAIDDIKGNLRAAIVWKDDPDNFLGWVEISSLLLRQSMPFELITDWQNEAPPNLLYKANNIDIGVIQ